MKANNFKIGDRIIVKAYDKMPVNLRTRGAARLCGKVGTITDKLFSNNLNDFVYAIKLDDFPMESKKMWEAECLELYSETVANYEFKLSAEGSRLYVTVYKDGNVIRSGWSYILHEGEFGVIQAVSFAIGSIVNKMREEQSNEES